MIWNAILFNERVREYNLFTTTGFHASSIEEAKKVIEDWKSTSTYSSAHEWTILAVDLQKNLNDNNVFPGATLNSFKYHLNFLIKTEPEKADLMEIYKAKFK